MRPTNGCYLYQGRDVKEDKDRCLKDQILVIAPHEALIPSDVWLKCRKKLMMNKTFQQGRKPKNTWLAGKVKCGRCGYALKATHVPNSPGYFRCNWTLAARLFQRRLQNCLLKQCRAKRNRSFLISLTTGTALTLRTREKPLTA